MSRQTFYHVTLKENTDSILDRGILAGQPSQWVNRMNEQLGDYGYVYLISDFSNAVRWAFKMGWDRNEESMAIVKVEIEDAVEPDTHWESVVYGRSWFKKLGQIAPGCIQAVFDLTPDLCRQAANGGSAEEPEGCSVIRP